MNLWELDEPAVDVVLRLHENRADPMTALVETSIAFGMPIEEVVASYRTHLQETEQQEEQYVVVGKSPFWKTPRYIDTYDNALSWRRRKSFATKMSLQAAEKIKAQVQGGANKYVVDVIPAGQLKESDELDLTPLIPVSQWVYDLYKVAYLDKENGREIRHQYMTAADEGHLESDIDANWPTPAATWYTYDVVAKDVGRPNRYKGFHGMVSDDGITHGRQVAAKLGLQ